MTASDGEFFDVLIIGAGISGIGAAYRLNQHGQCQQRHHAVLNRIVLPSRHSLKWDEIALADDCEIGRVFSSPTDIGQPNQPDLLQRIGICHALAELNRRRQSFHRLFRHSREQRIARGKMPKWGSRRYACAPGNLAHRQGLNSRFFNDRGGRSD